MTMTFTRVAFAWMLIAAFIASACGADDDGGGANDGGANDGGANDGGASGGGASGGGASGGGASGGAGRGGTSSGGGRGGASGTGTGGSVGAASGSGGNCSDTTSDPANCGACGRVCRNQDPVFSGFGCPEGECCVDGVCHPTWGSCITENQGYETCAEYCQSTGETCAEAECSSSTWAGFAAGDSCGEFGVAASGRADPCETPIPWGGAAVNVRCCCTDTD